MKKIIQMMMVLLLIFGYFYPGGISMENVYGFQQKDMTEINSIILDHTTTNTQSEIQYKKESYYFVEIPKTIYIKELEEKTSYALRVWGDLASDKVVQVVPIDKVPEKEGINVVLEDHGKEKEAVVISIVQKENLWNWRDCLGAGMTRNGSISMPQMTAGNWGGVLEFAIEFRDRK